MRKWLPLVILASAQFIMVLDSSVMNVSISQIVADLNTTVTGVQSAITMYTLVMAAFMLVGAKLVTFSAVIGHSGSALPCTGWVRSPPRSAPTSPCC